MLHRRPIVRHRRSARRSTRACWAHPLSSATSRLERAHGHVAHFAADIENAHSRCDSGIPKKALRSRCRYPGLPNQPQLLGRRMPKNVIRLRPGHDHLTRRRTSRLSCFDTFLSLRGSRSPRHGGEARAYQETSTASANMADGTQWAGAVVVVGGWFDAALPRMATRSCGK